MPSLVLFRMYANRFPQLSQLNSLRKNRGDFSCGDHSPNYYSAGRDGAHRIFSWFEKNKLRSTWTEELQYCSMSIKSWKLSGTLILSVDLIILRIPFFPPFLSPLLSFYVYETSIVETTQIVHMGGHSREKDREDERVQPVYSPISMNYDEFLFLNKFTWHHIAPQNGCA